jgi:hypothetical protein
MIEFLKNEKSFADAKTWTPQDGKKVNHQGNNEGNGHKQKANHSG